MGQILEIKNILILSSLTKFNTANYIISALKRYEYNVFVYSDVKSTNTDMYGVGFVSLREIINNTPFYPDLFIFIEGGSMKLFPYDLEEVTCITAWYGIDTHMDYEKHLIIARGFDVTFLAQKEYVSRLKKDGIKNVYWLPFGFDIELHANNSSKKKYDIAYVGGISYRHNKERFDLINNIKHKFTNYNLYFGPAEPKKMAEIYSQSWMVFNKSINNDINMRVFESTASGALLFTDKIINNGWNDLFKKKPFVIYKNENDLLNKIEFHLNNRSLIKKKVECILDTFMENHSYDHRMKKMLNYLQNIDKLNIKLESGFYLSILNILKLRKTVIKFLLKELYKNIINAK